MSEERRLESGEGMALEVLKAELRAARRGKQKEEKARVLSEIRAGIVKPPEGEFNVIVMDPPWPYDTSVEGTGTERGLTTYPTMSLEEISRLPVGGIAAEACVLWLWTTNAFVDAAWMLARSWGFMPKTMLTWDKERHGVGHYLLNQTEHCVVATRGSPVFDVSGCAKRYGLPTTMLSAPRREHSRKPDGFMRMVEELNPYTARLEMFAREKREGWTSWGAETEKFKERV